MTSDIPRKVLLVDDDVDFLEQLRMQFEAEGFKVLAAGGEKAAVEILEANRPDLAVLDLMMEHMDAGFNLAWRIKRIDESIPVILVTAVESETGMGFAPGGDWLKADAVLAKPVRFEQLKREIERLMP